MGTETPRLSRLTAGIRFVGLIDGLATASPVLSSLVPRASQSRDTDLAAPEMSYFWDHAP
eukprot:6952088-Pyramimonas_sp.AAC.1